MNFRPTKQKLILSVVVLILEVVFLYLLSTVSSCIAPSVVCEVSYCRVMISPCCFCATQIDMIINYLILLILPTAAYIMASILEK
jgi:hypothetical protein